MYKSFWAPVPLLNFDSPPLWGCRGGGGPGSSARGSSLGTVPVSSTMSVSFKHVSLCSSADTPASGSISSSSGGSSSGGSRTLGSTPGTILSTLMSTHRSGSSLARAALFRPEPNTRERTALAPPSSRPREYSYPAKSHESPFLSLECSVGLLRCSMGRKVRE